MLRCAKTRGKSKSSLGFAVISYFTKGTIGRTVFPVNFMLPHGRAPRISVKTPRDNRSLQMTVSPSGRLKRILTPSRKLDVNEVAHELLVFYPLLLAVQLQTSDKVLNWKNMELLQQLETKEIPKENCPTIVNEIQSFPEQKINLRL